MRLFFATMLMPNHQQQLTQWLQRLTLTSDVRMVSAEQLHLTLAFLGETSIEQLPLISRKIDTVTWHKFQITLDKIEHWVNAKVLCLTTSQATPQLLQQLVVNLRYQLQQLNLAPDQRTYYPHITLLKRITALPTLTKNNPSITLTPVEFCLVSSEVTHADPVYTIVERWPLR